MKHIFLAVATAVALIFLMSFGEPAVPADKRNANDKFPANSTKMYTQYKIVHGYSRQNLEDNVNRLLRKDWNLHGDMVWMGSGYMQVMTVREWASELPPLPAEPEEIK